MSVNEPTEAASSPARAKSSSDLRPRLIAGAVMAVVALALAYAGPKPFAVLVLAVALIMCWEWGKVVRGEEYGTALVIHALAVAAAGVLTAMGHAVLGVAAIIVGTIVLLVMPLGQRRLMSAAGVLYVGLPTIAMLWLRGDEPLGLLAVLFMFVIVWGSDIGAFAAGRGLGGPKLWPRVSPNKTWSGFVGGLAAAFAGGALFSLLVPGGSSVTLGLTGLVLAIVAQAGDLAESALKRGFGVKDSSQIIPGHGGVMDRADSIVAVSVAVAIMALIVKAGSPARALLGV